MIFIKNTNSNQGKNDFWIGFSDLMTGLMLVFIVLSITFMAIAKQKIDKIDAQKKNIIVILSKAMSANNIKVAYNSEKGTVTIAQDILFERKKYELKPKGKEFINLFAHTLDEKIFNKKEYKNLIKYIHIEGYASSKGEEEFNFKLSFYRAQSVWFDMTSKKLKNNDILRRKLNIVSRGEIEANQTKDDAKDRKVVFRFEFYDTYNKLFKGLTQ